MNPYRLAKAVRGKVTAQAVYDFVKGRSEMNTRSIAFILTALDLDITPRTRKRNG